jgi:Family of unknown function (DUF5681)
MDPLVEIVLLRLINDRGSRSCRRGHLFDRHEIRPRTLKPLEELKMEKPPKLVGYGHPPVEHRFQPGQSGNPSGRPKGARRFTADLLDELAEIVAVNDGEPAVTKQRAIVRVLIGKALKGDAHAIATVIGACARAVGEQHVDDEAEAPEDRAILRAVAASPAKNANSQPPKKPIEDK